jgi:hypothetical protein
MKKLVAAALAAALMSAAVPAFAVDEVVSVTFESIVATPAKDGSTIDPKLFSFGPLKDGASEDRSRAQGSAFHKDKQDACRWILLSSFLKFQRNAQAKGKHVVNVRTQAGDQESSKRDECLCLAGGFSIKSVVKGVYK